MAQVQTKKSELGGAGKGKSDQESAEIKIPATDKLLEKASQALTTKTQAPKTPAYTQCC